MQETPPSAETSSGHFGVSRESAIDFATQFATRRGYRVVASLDGLAWSEDPPLVSLEGARWIDGEWAVLFDMQLPPGFVSVDPNGLCVFVSGETGGCRIYPLL